MPFLQRATNNYFGFAPAYGNQRTNIYLVSSSATPAQTPFTPETWWCIPPSQTGRT